MFRDLPSNGGSFVNGCLYLIVRESESTWVTSYYTRMCLKQREYPMLLWTCINKHWNIRKEISRTVSCTPTLSITTEYAIRITCHNYNESQKPSTLMKGEITSEMIYFKGFVHPYTLKLIMQNTTLQSEILSKRFHMWYTTSRISQ
jgi:hypothetical protein